MVKKSLNKLYLFFIFLFLYAPLIVLIVFSFNASKSTAQWSGFSLKWYGELIKDRHIIKALYYTLACALLSSIIATGFGTITAFGLFYMKKLPKKVLLTINNLPLLNPDIVTGISLMTLFVGLSFVKLKLGFTTMLLAHIVFNTPYVILSILPKLKKMPSNILHAALDLGATPWYAFRKIILPEIRPGMLTGFLIAFTMSVDDFVISYFTTGNGVTNLSITVYSMARRGIKPTINALSTLMFLTVLVLLLIINHFSDNLEGDLS